MSDQPDSTAQLPLPSDGIDLCWQTDTGPATKRLVHRILRRELTPAIATRLIQTKGANPDALVGFREKASGVHRRTKWVPLLSLAIDDPTGSVPSVWRMDSDLKTPLLLTPWSSRQLQRDILQALISCGANVNFHYPDHELDHEGMRPIRVASETGNIDAVEVLLATNQVNHISLPLDGFSPLRPSQAYGDALIGVARRLLQHDPSKSGVAVLLAATSRPLLSKAFTYEYMDTLVQHGNPIPAANLRLILRYAAGITTWSSHWVVDYLCERLATPADISHAQVGVSPPLRGAASQLEELLDDNDNDNDDGDDMRDETAERIRNRKLMVRSLLRAGADLSTNVLPTNTPLQRKRRELVLKEYVAVLNELPFVVMDAINAALGPQRDADILMTRILPLVDHNDEDASLPHPPSLSPLSFGPQEAAAIAWKIGAFLHDPPAALTAIDSYLTNASAIKRRVRGAVEHFVEWAATKTVSNREVVGGWSRGPDGQMVRVPQLQCFAVDAGQRHTHRRLGFREVVHRARLDEVRQHGLEVVKGFNNEEGNDDCQFQWGRLGYVTGQTGQQWVSLGIN
ncbi:unnamed protein product [Vitrella brassicaformis CCMP3155]|uniref:Uncharacterized protein n=1 Tax=Vitrella brassicaformis (strain CCMP3155) TaxID=1169540 RepID=A0A0G4FSB6_VITBC|nr:unnamed protein product [Vitrella brassicaformis CCMP3155]|eukprot:CEM17579.1 unnamed protein product [Vitrella brassicaformis CCMP3155]